ncbi:Hypothetical protein SRAE_1000270800 [Strongyloides ratti]|uniref:Uncharacterized protein n=1 Tax=Strongyloides ratti TaxID=34506 RepID=A0A090MWX7_STRRB|nr:Hypothetical protein SRAE_1000270800 [Strongyloides ratti]CEF64454.1 Hypothetical protein SRAE_1000270800 [Strongyloides ratti]
MVSKLLRKLKLKTSIRNKIAILFIFSCCFISVFYLISKIHSTTNEYNRRSLKQNENINELYLISKFLYIYNETSNIEKRKNLNTLNLLFLSKQKEQTKVFLCISKNKNGEILKSKLNFSLLDLLTKETYLYEGSCKILTNYISFFIEINKKTIEIEEATEIIHVPLKVKDKSVCILPLLLFSNTDYLKNVVEYYKTNLYTNIDIYGISLKNDTNNILDYKYDFVKNHPWFIFNTKETLNVIRNFHTISFTKNNVIESMKSAIFDCYFRYKDISSEIIFLNLNNYFPMGTNYSYINEIFVSPVILKSSNKNITENDSSQILKNINFNLQQNNNTDSKNNYLKIIETGECFCINECSDVCGKFNSENIIIINVKNPNKKENKINDKLISMNDFDLIETEYFETMLVNKCSLLFQDQSSVENNLEQNNNKVAQTFNNVLRYFQSTQYINEEKKCILSLLFDNMPCIVSNLSFNNLLNITNLYLPFNQSFTTFNDGCHF